MLMKDSQAENTLELFNVLDKFPQGLQMYYVEYLRAEALLQKGEYQKAIAAYQKFQKGYKSSSYLKDSYYKISLCYWLMGDEQQAKSFFEKAKVSGKANAEPDKYAAKQLEEGIEISERANRILLSQSPAGTQNKRHCFSQNILSPKHCHDER
jgi:TolA-binding protein